MEIAQLLDTFQIGGYARGVNEYGSATASESLRQAGLRVTASRLAVLRALENGVSHLDADAVATAARARLGSLSTQAVYDNLRVLTDAGLLRRFEPAGSPARYERRVGDNHHHAVCRSCGAASDIACAVGLAPCLEPATSNGFLIDEAEVIYWGMCPACQTGIVRENAK